MESDFFMGEAQANYFSLARFYRLFCFVFNQVGTEKPMVKTNIGFFTKKVKNHNLLRYIKQIDTKIYR